MGNASPTQQATWTAPFRVGDWRVDASSNRLSRGDTTVKLEPRAIKVLVCLAERAGETVTREQLEEEVWHGMVVGYDALSHTITKLRKAFDDDPHHPQIIETISKVGYRLIAEVSYPSPVPKSAQPELPTAETTVTRPQLPRGRLVAGAAALVALVTAAALLAWFKPWEPGEEPVSMDHQALPLPDKPSIAVLPFANLSDDRKQEYFSDGMTDDLITGLSKVSGLFVIARNSTFTYKGKPIKAQQVAQELGVRYVLEGSVRRAGDQVRINAQLVDATTGGHLWAERYDGTLEDMFALQDKITQKIVVALAVSLTADEKAQQNRGETDNLEAHDAFLEGLERWNIYTPDDLAKAVPYLETAIELDPNYAHAHALLAAVYFDIGTGGWERSLGISTDDVMEKAKRHLQEAMKNPTPRAHYVAAKMLTKQKRWDEALAEAERGIALDPNDHAGYSAMARILTKTGRYAEGLDFAKKAQRLDPLVDHQYRIGSAQFHMGRYEEAAATMLRATKRTPGDEWNFLYLAAAYGQLRREKEAKSAIETFNEMRAEAGKGPYTLARIDNLSFKHQADRERLREGLRKAGLPE